MPGFELWTDDLNISQLLDNIKGIHNNQFYDTIEK